MALPKKLARALASRLGAGAVMGEAADRYVHAFDATATPILPDAVVVPSTVEELAWACETLWAAGVPTTPRGAGTGYAGGAVPACGGVVVVCDRLKGIRGPVSGFVDAEPGVVGDDLNRFLKRSGRFYPVDPASGEASTVGGHVATNAGGPRALKYGVTRDYVDAVEVISPARGRELLSGAPGKPDVLSILVGSEGTLAVFMGIRLRVLARPELTAAAVATFDEAETAARVSNDVLRAGIVPAKMEFLDRLCVECVNAKEAGVLDEGATAALMFEFDGSEAAVTDELAAAAEIARAASPRRVETAADGAAAERLWRARRGISPALGMLAPHKVNEDVCVPRSRILALLEFVAALGEQYGVPVPTFGHIGDGNLHVNFMYDRRVAKQRERVAEAASRLMARVVELGGTITGEHGVGLAKMPFLPLEQSEAEFAYAAQLKELFDPSGLLNPGKIFTGCNEVVR
jgi:glycolate oxidase